MKQRVEKLLALPTISDDEKAELTILFNARQKTLSAYNEDNTAARKKDYDAAKDGLQQLVDTLDKKYTNSDQTPAQHIAADPGDTMFKNTTAMLDYLKQHGYGITSLQTLRNHVTAGTLILTGKAVTVAAFQAWQRHPEGGHKYYENYVKQNTEKFGSIEENALRKSSAETKQAEIKARKLEREEQQELGNLITREEADIEVCAWTAMTRDAIMRHITKSLPHIIHAVGGQLASLADAQAIVDQAGDDACNEIANSGEVDVEFTEDMEGEEVE